MGQSKCLQKLPKNLICHLLVMSVLGNLSPQIAQRHCVIRPFVAKLQQMQH